MISLDPSKIRLMRQSRIIRSTPMGASPRPSSELAVSYMHSPPHRQTDEIGLPLVDKMISQDLTDDEGPATGDKIPEIHKSRFENDPELLGLIKDLGSDQGSGVPDNDTKAPRSSSI
jgi:hypothetical protein